MTAVGLRLYPGDVTFPSDISTGLGLIEGLIGDFRLAGTDAFGCNWRLISPLQGWDGSPGGSEQTTQKPRGGGAYGSPNEMTARPVVLQGIIEAPDPDSLQDAIDRLNDAATLTDTVLTLQRGSKARSLICHRSGEVNQSDDADLGDSTMRYALQVIGLDPRKFATALTATTGLPSASGGTTFPMTFPMSFDSTVESGECTLTNPGNAVGPVTLRIDGPITGPQITHVTSGLVLQFDPTLELGVGDWLDVDMENEKAFMNGTASRGGYVTQRGWSGFVKGVNVWSFAAASGTGTLTVNAVPAWQ